MTQVCVILWWVLLFNLSTIIHRCECGKVALSHITLLLPYTSRYKDAPTQYKITSHGGLSNDCVSWTVEPKHGVLEIVPKRSHECPSNTYNEAIVKAISSPQNGRISATITALDPKSGSSAECEVFIDKVHELAVATSTRLIYLGKYESIEVHGFDDKGNKFTTLQGLPMIWTGIGAHLQRISFEEASLMLPEAVTESFSYEHTNNPLPVKGIETGQEDVRVAIDAQQSPAHRGCVGATASLFVVMQLQLVPRVLYASKCTHAQFDLVTSSLSSVDDEEELLRLHAATNVSLSSSSSAYRHQIKLPQEQYQLRLQALSASSSSARTPAMSVSQTALVRTSNVVENAKLLVEDKVTSHQSIENTADARVLVEDAHDIFAEVIKYKQFRRRPNVYFARHDQAQWHLTLDDEYFVRLTLRDVHGNFMCTRDLHVSELDHEHKNTRFLRNLQTWRQQYVCDHIEWNVQVIADDAHTDADDVVQVRVIDKRDNEFIIKALRMATFTLQFTAKGTACRQPLILASTKKQIVVTTPVRVRNTTTVDCTSTSSEDQQAQPQQQRRSSAPPLLLIPYTAANHAHRAPLFFGGGSGRYRLEMNDSNVAYLSSTHDITKGQTEGGHTVHGHEVGRTQLFVIDYANPDNFDVVDVEVARIAVWRLQETIQKEIGMQSAIQVPLMIRDARNRRFSALDGVKEVVTTSSVHKRVSVEFVATSIAEMYQQYAAQKTLIGADDDDDDGDDGEGVNAGTATTTLSSSSSSSWDCSRCCDGVVIVHGLRAGYERFEIGFVDERRDLVRHAGMFVSVYEEIVPQHLAVAIAININEAYIMRWVHGPLPWPLDVSVGNATKFDEAFVSGLLVDVVSGDGVHEKNQQKKKFGIRYNGKTLEFVCYQPFHATLQLRVSNRKSDSLPLPVTSVADIEVFCFPPFQFNASKIEMGVGTRRAAAEFFPDWLKQDEAAAEFTVALQQQDQDDDNVVSIVSAQHLVAKRLGSCLIQAQFEHPTQRVYVHRPGFDHTLQIVVLFKDFAMQMASLWMMHGQAQMAHIEGVDGHRHILPFRHNFDDVDIVWKVEDPSVVRLMPVVAPPLINGRGERDGVVVADGKTDEQQQQQSPQQQHGMYARGLSIKMVAHSVGQSNVRAQITLRNAPTNIKSEFEIVKTVTVIPRVVDDCNALILKPNSTYALSARYNPDTSVVGVGNVYKMYIDQRQKFIHVNDRRQPPLLSVDKHAPIGHHVALTFLLQSEQRAKHAGATKTASTKQYPLTQASSLMISIVEGAGLHLVHAHTAYDNAVFSHTMDVGSSSSSSASASSLFWSSSKHKGSNVHSTASANKYRYTDNILCERQNISLKVAILDELARNLHVMDQIKVISNDTSVILPAKDIQIREESADSGGAMFATVHLHAAQPGFAVLTFREKDIDPSTPTLAEIYVYDDPKFLRSFVTIQVVSSAECRAMFGVEFAADDVWPMPHAHTAVLANGTAAVHVKRKSSSPAAASSSTQDLDYKNGRNWKAKTWSNAFSMVNSNNNNLVGLCMVVLLLLVIVCSWGRSCVDALFGSTQYQNHPSTPATFNPYAALQDSSIFQVQRNPSPFRRNI